MFDCCRCEEEAIEPRESEIRWKQDEPSGRLSLKRPSHGVLKHSSFLSPQKITGSRVVDHRAIESIPLSVSRPEVDIALKKNELHNLQVEENHLHQRIKQLDQFYIRQIRPLEAQCAQLEVANNLRSQQISILETRIRGLPLRPRQP